MARRTIGAVFSDREPCGIVGREQTLQRPWRLILLTALPLWIGVGVTRLATFMLTEDRVPGVFYVAIKARLFHLGGIMLVALLCYRLALNVRWQSGQRLRAVLIHAALAFAVGFVSRPLLIASAAWFDPAFTLSDDWLDHFARQGVRYWLISGAGFVSSYVFGLALLLGMRASLELRDAELDKARLHNDWMRSRLQVLRMQMNPHFIFNALNTISSAISVDPERANALVVKISELFRRSLALGDDEWVSLQDELAFVDAYLQIEMARFGARLRCSTEAPAHLLQRKIPTLLLQPLIENAIRHGVADDRDTLQIWVRAHAPDDEGAAGRMHIEIGNRSSGSLATAQAEPRVGLGNTRARLFAIYGGDASLDLRRPDAFSFLAVLRLPRTVANRAVLQ